jgi:GNAT superfamily N-acetyltransferase
VAGLLERSYGSLVAGDYPAELLGRALPLMARPNPDLLSCPTWFVAEHPETGEVVGCGGWTARPPTAAAKPERDSGGEDGAAETAAAARTARPHLRHFAADPAHARSGIGAALWRRVRSSMWEELGPGLGDVEVYSTITAVPFYESCGFVKVREVVVNLSPTCQFPCWLMALQSRSVQR